MPEEMTHINRKLLIVDDEINICRSLARLLKLSGYTIHTFTSSEEALSAMKENSFDLILSDLNMPEMDGISFLINVKKINKDVPVIIMTAFSTVETAVEAMKKGAYDYISKPFNEDELLLKVERALNNKAIRLENKLLKEELGDRYKFSNIIGKSKVMQKIFRTVEKVAATDATVLIQGESGTGKELIAKAVHFNSFRKDKPCIYLDCSSIVESLLESELFGHEKGSFTGAFKSKKGIFEEAQDGTLFLDEIGNISLPIQAKLLRVLQEREIKPVGSNTAIKVNIRLITATNMNLEEMIEKGDFRNDLYYRLNVVPIYLPPLREREGDILLLINHFLNEFNKKINKNIKNVTPAALSLMENYKWPGNVRELENVIERLVVMCDTEIIDSDQLPSVIRNTGEDDLNNIKIPQTNAELIEAKKDIREKVVLKLEKVFILEALKKEDWNVSHAAKSVGMKRENFHAMMKRCGVSATRSFGNNE